MLSLLSYFVVLISMSAAMWLAFYLFARGFPSLLALQTTFALTAMAIFFWLTYNHFFNPLPQLNYVKAILLNVAMASWYEVTYRLLEKNAQQKWRWMRYGLYALLSLSILLLFLYKPESSRRFDDELYVAQLDGSLPNVVYSLTQIGLTVSLMFNLFIGEKIRFTPQGRLFLAASFCIALALVYGVVSLIFPTVPFLRLVQDGLVFSGFFILGLSVLRHQSLLERRTVFQDFPLTLLVIASLALIYIFLASVFFQVQANVLASLIGVVVITHSVYDLTREFLERYRAKQERQFRKTVLHTDLQESQTYLQNALEALCLQINASAGLVAVREGEHFAVVASNNSISVNSEAPYPPFSDTATHLVSFSRRIKNIQWASSIFDDNRQIAFVGIGEPIHRIDYSSGELDLLQEFTDYVSLILSISTNRKENQEVFQSKYQTATANVIEALSHAPDETIVKMTEEGLRKFHDYIHLGQSPLAEWLNAPGSSHIERGKKVQAILRNGIESLRPSGERPEEPLPRDWYNYAILYDAYIKGVSNNEVMARLYVSEGTFHRTRRNAVRGVTRWLIEKKISIASSKSMTNVL
ncbi:MAG: GAF domain-containing protein [Anaerolineales bacterium]|nr:GAF domain-containing protein [Anaerolineales bacterium]